jgi:beta-xylosidase
MKRTIIITFLFQLSFFTYAQYQTSTNEKGIDYYVNPIFAGDYPDPSILRDGNDYYIVHSSFEYYPGLLIWHSKDLINWTPVTNALHKYVGSVWAPDLVKYNNKYYIYFPANNSNYVVTADSINGTWSEPIDLKVGNIDPGHVTDQDGKLYLYFSSGGYVPLSDNGLSVAGEFKQTYNGWPIPRDYTIECFCLEGPKLVKRGDYYYLTTAEGGTAGPATSHMIISARSKSPFGPWENSPYNPIIRTIENSEKWWSKGHGTLFEDSKGNWWIVFHGYENGHYNMGRQTLLQPVEWTKEGWFKSPDGIKTDEPIKRPISVASKIGFTLNDSFDGKTLKPQWKFFGEYDTSRFHLVNNSLVLHCFAYHRTIHILQKLSFLSEGKQQEDWFFFITIMHILASLQITKMF